MNENEQIMEMAKIIDDTQCIGMTIKACRAETRLGNSCGMCKAKRLYSKGYRKLERGEWNLIGNGNGRAIHWKCSICGYETLDAVNGDTNFCPNCGADMRGEKE